MIKTSNYLRHLTLLFFSFWVSIGMAQVPASNIIEVIEDDQVATIYWNSKTATYHSTYDPYKQQGIYSYLIEWGKVSEGYTNSEVTPYRVFMIQPLDSNEMYQARVYSLDKYGNKSVASNPVQFQHNSTRVASMRNRLNGFFDDFNTPMGAFDEKKWNQSYGGCMTIGMVSQHVNDQYHGHNVVTSGECDRGVASSRVREIFDFTDRTGTIEFDLDGSKLERQFWYLDLTPASRKRDLTGHTSLETNGTPPQSDPAYLLRFIEKGSLGGSKVSVSLADGDGNLINLNNQYQNGACGNGMEFCNGENLQPVPNVRRHWKIELSKTAVKVFINDILIVDASLITAYTPNGLPFEQAQVNWLFFSYNTTKENSPTGMLHWDNFGFDAPTGWQDTTVIHNYTDGKLGTTTPTIGNEKSVGMTSSLSMPAFDTIPIPDPILDTAGNWPIKSELMFTIQGSEYSWTADDSIIVNGHHYVFPEPTSLIPSLSSSSLTSTTKPYSAILDIMPQHLVQGDNHIAFYLNNPRLLNVHIELEYPDSSAPVYTQPKDIFANYTAKLMNFKNYTDIGPGLIFAKIDGIEFWQSEFQRVTNSAGGITKIVKQTPVSGTIEMDILGNTNAQLAVSGHAKGIAYYEIWIDQQVIETIQVDTEEAVAYFDHKAVELNTANFPDGVHELFIQGYDVDGNVSVLDVFLGNVQHGEYLPVELTFSNKSFEIRTVNGTGNLIDVQMRCTAGTPPMTSDITENIAFGLKWDSSAGIDLGAPSGNYQITASGSETISETYEYQAFVTNVNQNFPENWTQHQWVTVLSVPVSNLDVSAASIEVCELAFQVSTDANINVSTAGISKDYTPTINGNATIHDTQVDNDGDSIFNYEDCDPNDSGDAVLVLNDQPIANGIYPATNKIESAALINTGGNVHFKASLGITLKPGFKTQLGAQFLAKIDTVCAMPLVLTLTYHDISCVGEMDGSASISIVKGNGNYTYAWNTGASTSSIDSLAQGIYTVTVTDGASQTATATAAIGMVSNDLDDDTVSDGCDCDPNDPNDAILTVNDSPLFDSTYTAYNQMTVTGIAQSDSSVYLKASINVRLLPGFKANAGSYVNILIEDVCVPPAMSLWGNAVIETTEETSNTENRAVLKIKEDVDIRLFPNPTSGRLQMQTKHSIQQFWIYDLMGKKVLTGIGNEADLSNLPNGTYILRIHCLEKSFVERVVKHE